LQILRAVKLQPDNALFLWVKEQKIGSVDDLMIPLRHVKPNKLMEYLEKQYEVSKDKKGRYGGLRYHDTNNVLTEYKDYLNACETLGYDLTDIFILFPRDLIKAHDQASNMMDRKKVAQYDEQIAAINDRLSKLYRYQEDGFVVLPPKSAQEIVVEGQKLHHCVGSYVASVIENRCAILFIRKKENPDNPFFTVEVRGNEIIQVQGKGHKAPTPEIKEFLNRWTKKKALKMKTAA